MPNTKALKAVIQYVKTTKRFQPRAVVAEEAREVGEAEVERERGERVDEAGGSP